MTLFLTAASHYLFLAHVQKPILKLCLDVEVFGLQGCCKCCVEVKQTAVYKILPLSIYVRVQKRTALQNTYLSVISKLLDHGDQIAQT